VCIPCARSREPSESFLAGPPTWRCAFLTHATMNQNMTVCIPCARRHKPERVISRPPPLTLSRAPCTALSCSAEAQRPLGRRGQLTQAASPYHDSAARHALERPAPLPPFELRVLYSLEQLGDPWTQCTTPFEQRALRRLGLRSALSRRCTSLPLSDPTFQAVERPPWTPCFEPRALCSLELLGDS